MLESVSGRPNPQSSIVLLYRQRARQVIKLARTARRQGKVDAARGLTDEALLWRAYATDWGRRLSTSML